MAFQIEQTLLIVLLASFGFSVPIIPTLLPNTGASNVPFSDIEIKLAKPMELLELLLKDIENMPRHGKLVSHGHLFPKSNKILEIIRKTAEKFLNENFPKNNYIMEDAVPCHYHYKQLKQEYENESLSELCNKYHVNEISLTVQSDVNCFLSSLFHLNSQFQSILFQHGWNKLNKILKMTQNLNRLADHFEILSEDITERIQFSCQNYTKVPSGDAKVVQLQSNVDGNTTDSVNTTKTVILPLHPKVSLAATETNKLDSALNNTNETDNVVDKQAKDVLPSQNVTKSPSNIIIPTHTKVVTGADKINKNVFVGTTQSTEKSSAGIPESHENVPTGTFHSTDKPSVGIPESTKNEPESPKNVSAKTFRNTEKPSVGILKSSNNVPVKPSNITKNVSVSLEEIIEKKDEDMMKVSKDLNEILKIMSQIRSLDNKEEEIIEDKLDITKPITNDNGNELMLKKLGKMKSGAEKAVSDAVVNKDKMINKVLKEIMPTSNPVLNELSEEKTLDKMIEIFKK